MSVNSLLTFLSQCFSTFRSSAALRHITEKQFGFPFPNKHKKGPYCYTEKGEKKTRYPIQVLRKIQGDQGCTKAQRQQSRAQSFCLPTQSPSPPDPSEGLVLGDHTSNRRKEHKTFLLPCKLRVLKGRGNRDPFPPSAFHAVGFTALEVIRSNKAWELCSKKGSCTRYDLVLYRF